MTVDNLLIATPTSRAVPTPRGNHVAKREEVLLTRVGLRMPTVLAFEDWERAGRQLSGIVDSSSWCLGDWLVYGKRHFADRYKRAIRAAGLQYQTLRNYAWVARRFSLDRRREALTFQHHAEVASLPLGDQEHWLDAAERGTWSTKQLRTQLRESRVPGEVGATAVQTSAVLPRIEIQGRQLSLWRKAADQTGAEFDSWVVNVLDRAAEQVLDESDSD